MDVGIIPSSLNNNIIQQTDQQVIELNSLINEYGFIEIKQLENNEKVFYYSDRLFGFACKLLSSYENKELFNRFLSFCNYHSISRCLLNPQFQKLLKHYTYKRYNIYDISNITSILNVSKLVEHLISYHYKNYYTIPSLSNDSPQLKTSNTPTSNETINNYWNYIFTQVVSNQKYNCSFISFIKNIICRYSGGLTFNKHVIKILEIQFKNDKDLSTFIKDELSKLKN